MGRKLVEDGEALVQRQIDERAPVERRSGELVEQVGQSGCEAGDEEVEVVRDEELGVNVGGAGRRVVW